MPIGDIKATAKRKAKDKVVKTAKRKISGNSRGRRKSPAILILLLVLVVGAVGALWYFGFLDDIIDSFVGESAPAIVAVDGQLEIHFIDVGQADATLIISDGYTMLIDAGSRNSGPRVVEYLQNLGITKLTYVVATHPHEDHIGGMDLVLNGFQIGQVLLPDVSHTTRTYERMIEAIENHQISTSAPVAGHTFNMGGAIFTVIHPNADNYRNLNDWSLSLRMAFGNVSMVTTGDAEALAEREIIDAGHYLRADILRLGHHGSRTSTTQEFLDAVSPSIAIIQVGEGNRYGHPHPEVMERLYAANLRIYRNDLHGDIILTTDGTEINITTERAS
ncbi:MAG: MBL fold metallo-hydrolase [Defluviitaleaceae bacterium]|nr:MBL fold metallo-hydrolase [Defluviitaleaceae bacterium]